MTTDRPPAAAGRRREYDKSDGLIALSLPPEALVRPLTEALHQVTASGDAPAVRDAGMALLAALSTHYGVEPPSLQVLGVRPHRLTEGVCTYQLFGDYTPATGRIRVWMRTAIREKVCSPRALLNVLLHEFCHHLDVTHLSLPESFHTRGFFIRIDQLYHHVLATPAEARRPLRWIKRGGSWSVDWRLLSARGRATR